MKIVGGEGTVRGPAALSKFIPNTLLPPLMLEINQAKRFHECAFKLEEKTRRLLILREHCGRASRDFVCWVWLHVSM